MAILSLAGDTILSALSPARNWQHMGSDPVLLLSNFATIKRIRPEDAVYIQLEARCRVLLLAGQYVQLNLERNVCLKEVSRQTNRMLTRNVMFLVCHGKPRNTKHLA